MTFEDPQIAKPESAHGFRHPEINAAFDPLRPTDNALAAANQYGRIAQKWQQGVTEFAARIRRSSAAAWDGPAAERSREAIGTYADRATELTPQLTALATGVHAAVQAISTTKTGLPPVVPGFSWTSPSTWFGLKDDDRDDAEEEARRVMDTHYVDQFLAADRAIPVLPTPIGPTAPLHGPLTELGGTDWRTGGEVATRAAVESAPDDRAGSGEDGNPLSGGDFADDATSGTGPADDWSTQAAATPGGSPGGTTGSSAAGGPATGGPLAGGPGAGSPASGGALAGGPATGGSRSGGPGSGGSRSGSPGSGGSTSGNPGPRGLAVGGGTPGSPNPGRTLPGTPTPGAVTPTARPATPPSRTGLPGMPGAPAASRAKDDDEHRVPDYLVTAENTDELLGELPPTVPGGVLGVDAPSASPTHPEDR